MTRKSGTPTKRLAAATPNGAITTSRLRALPTCEQIAQRAHARFVARGGEHGHDVDDWLEAERELVDERPIGSRRTR